MAYINTGQARATEIVFEYWLGDAFVSEKRYSILAPEFGQNINTHTIQTMSEQQYRILMNDFIQWCKQQEGQPNLTINPDDAIITDVVACPIGR